MSQQTGGRTWAAVIFVVWRTENDKNEWGALWRRDELLSGWLFAKR